MVYDFVQAARRWLVCHAARWWMTPLAGALGGYLAQLIGWPLPWMIGALFGVMAVRCLGYLTEAVPYGLRLGQLIIATGIGLHFNQAVLAEVLQDFNLVLLGAVLTLVSGAIGMCLHRRQGVDQATAFFASMPGGASEMVNLGRMEGADPQRVAASQTLRMMTVLLIVPPAYNWLLFESKSSLVSPVAPDAFWLILLFSLGAALALVFQRWRIPNAWQMGALLISISLSSYFDLHTRLPNGLGEVGQWLLGSAMGCHIDRSFFRRAPAFMARSLLAVLLTVLLAIPLAGLLSSYTGFDMKTLLLGLIPGSVAEMSLTAAALNLPVPLVTAMQVLRLILVLFLAQVLFRCWRYLSKPRH